MPPRVDHPPERVPWWQTRSGSIGALIVTLVLLALLALLLADRVGGALSEVGRDEDGTDPWTDPIGLEPVAGGLLVGRIPDCAAAPVTRITVWDQDSQPVWDVVGPPTALPSFIVGVTPPGFEERTRYDDPGDGTLVRLVVNRRLLGVAGVRYAADDLGRRKITTYYDGAYHTFSRSGFPSANVCKERSGSTNLLPDGQHQDDGSG
jgi:hypothetical protein